MRKAIYIVALPLVFMTGACGIYSKFDRPEVEYDAGKLVEADTLNQPLSAIPWQELFTDPYLKTWIERGLEANTDLRVAQLNVEKAAATYGASKLAYLPSLSIGAEASTGNKSDSRFQIGPSASWEIDIFGKQRNLKKSAEAAFYASEAYRQAVQTSLIASIAEGYYNLLMLDNQLEISESTLKIWESNIRAMKALKRAGRSNEAGQLQATANKLKVESSARTLREQIAIQENAVRSLLLDPDMDMSRGKLSAQSFPDSIASGVSIELLSNRPDVLAAEYDLQKAFYDVNVSRSAFYPSLKLSGNAGWSTSSGSGIGNPSAWIANALGSLTAPIFDRGTNNANLKISKAQYEIASLKFQQTLLDAGMEVNDALVAWQTAQDRLKIDAEQINVLEKAVRTTQLLMRNSPTNYLEVLTAQQRLLEAQLTETADKYSEIEAVITLYHALGGGK